MIEALKEKFEGLRIWDDESDRPWFKFAGGQRGQAASRVHVALPGAEEIDFGMCTIGADAPVLAGGDFMESVEADVDYLDNRLKLLRFKKEPKVDLERTSSKRRPLDMVKSFSAVSGANAVDAPGGGISGTGQQSHSEE